MRRMTQYDPNLYTTTFTDLNPGTEYRVRVAGVNTRGSGTFSEYANAQTDGIIRQTVVRGSSVILNCSASSLTPTNVMWSREYMQPLTPEAKLVGRYLLLLRAREEDSGRYVCNSGTGFSSSYDLQVLKSTSCKYMYKFTYR